MRYFLSSVVCLLFFNTNVFASEVLHCSIKPKLRTSDNTTIYLGLKYTALVKNTSERYIEQAYISFEIESMKTLNHNGTFEFNAYPNEGKNLEIEKDLVSHYSLSEDIFVKELEKTNVLFEDVMNVLNKEEVKCSILY
ncbi:hypothetical protein N9809_04470 [Amylibacter sp.]|nr:hypothetical protein [Amylibacter sp.]